MIDSIIHIFFITALIISAVYFIFLTISSIIYFRMRPSPPTPDTLPPVSILKPLKGIDDELEFNLKSFFELDYPEYELIFGVREENDPSIPIVKNLRKNYPHIPSHLVICDHKIGLNPKINNLNNILKASRHDHLLISDSNVRVPSDYLKDLVAHLFLPDTGLVTSTIRGVKALKLGSVLENLHLNSFIAPNVFAIDTLIHLPISIGKSMLMSRDTLNRIGGLAAFANVLAEDHLMGATIKNLGMQVRTTPRPVNNINQYWTVKNFYHRHLRWAKLRKNINIYYYILEALSNPIPIAILYNLIQPGSLSLFVLGTLTTLKILLDYVINRLLNSDIKWYQFFLIPVKDLIIGMIWIIPFWSRRVSWRGNQFIISDNTRLIPI